MERAVLGMTGPASGKLAGMMLRHGDPSRTTSAIGPLEQGASGSALALGWRQAIQRWSNRTRRQPGGEPLPALFRRRGIEPLVMRPGDMGLALAGRAADHQRGRRLPPVDHEDAESEGTSP